MHFLIRWWWTHSRHRSNCYANYNFIIRLTKNKFSLGHTTDTHHKEMIEMKMAPRRCHWISIFCLVFGARKRNVWHLPKACCIASKRASVCVCVYVRARAKIPSINFRWQIAVLIHSLIMKIIFIKLHSQLFNHHSHWPSHAFFLSLLRCFDRFCLPWIVQRTTTYL